MRQKIELAAAFLMLAALIWISRCMSRAVSGDAVTQETVTVVLDAGHGGSDPGKIGVNGTEEKDINLLIARKTKKLLKKAGIQVIMTRTKDEMLTGRDGSISKAADMQARVAAINHEKPALAVSIHQNSYHEESVKGAQVFYYSQSQDGKEAAQLMQDSLQALDPENHRQIKANDSYYLLKRTEVPTIIVECGFLSNQEEAELLSGAEYQEQAAAAIASGIQSFVAE